MTVKSILAVLAAGLVCAALSTGALASPTAKKPLTGIWSGKTHQEIAPLGPDADFVDWTQHIVIRAYKGRLASLGVSVRYTCPDDTNPLVGDIALSLDWKLGRGPVLTQNGGFLLRVRKSRNILTGKMGRLPIPVSISGILGAGGGSGRFDLSGGGCSGKGSWRTKRTSRL